MQVNREWYAEQSAALAPALAADPDVEIYDTGTCLVGRVRVSKPDLEVWIASPACNLDIAGEEYWTVALVVPEEGGVFVDHREFDDATEIATHLDAMRAVADDRDRHTYLPSADVSESCEVCGHSRHHAWHLPYN